MSHCQHCESIATHKCSICNGSFCEECAKQHLAFFSGTGSDIKMIKLEESPDAKTL